MVKEIVALADKVGKKVDKIYAMHLIKRKLASTAKMVEEENRIKRINLKLYRLYN